MPPITVARPRRNPTGFFLGLVRQPRPEPIEASTSPEARLATRLILLCHAATAMARAGGFAHADEPLDTGGLRAAKDWRPTGPAPRHLLTSPALAARQTASMIGGVAEIDPALRDVDAGRWTGQSLAVIHATDSVALEAWIADPAAGAPGGETMAAAAERIAPWLAAQAARDSPVLAVTHPMVVRAAIAAALGLPVGATLRIDLAPLSVTELSFNRVWRLQALGSPADVPRAGS